VSSSSGGPKAEVSGQPEPASGRYQLLGTLGGGGMAIVHEVLDRATGRRVAQKRLRPQESEQRMQRTRELFEREFHTLAQLAHPRVVEVYDYGVDERGPYYTMELLDGGDLERLVPGPYRRVCAIARDVCSALSLLHSRRIVHRDVSPRNVRCTSDGLAKLIDFGAMTRMGVIKDLVGTPVYCPPEVLHLQAIDGRADLYALGATLYYVLTGRHAYPVREFAALPKAWQFGIARPSELVAGIPAALDDLVLDLLQQDPERRPATAAEVMERLSAIEGRTLQENLLVAQSYLTTPVFVGREPELAAVRAKAARALEGQGSALLVLGEAGVGRSRFLDQNALAGQLLGLTVIRADADDAASGDYGVMRRLLAQLQQTQPALVPSLEARERAVLRAAFPELIAAEAGAARADVTRAQLQNALQHALIGASRRAPLLIAIDDLHRTDEPSLSALGLLARELRGAPMIVVASAERSAAPRASLPFEAFASAASEIALLPLELAEAQTLLASMFGASPHLDTLTPRLLSLSQGIPRDLMRLAQHLVDCNVVRYQGGAWSLPEQLEAQDLPESVAQLLAARVRACEPSARALAAALALCPEKSFSFEECFALAAHGDTGRLMTDLVQLSDADVVRSVDDRYSITDRAWVPVVLDTVSPEELARLHLRLSAVFERQPGEEFRSAQHLLRAGDTQRALDRFVAHAVISRQQTDRDPEAYFSFVRSQPSDWMETYEQAIAECRRLGRPRGDAYALHMRLSGIVAMVGLPAKTATMSALVSQLTAAAGLDDWAQLDASLPPRDRILRALETARARWQTLPDDERLMEPMTALRELTIAVRHIMGPSAPNFDLPMLRELPSLAPYVALSPTLGVIEQLRIGVLARVTGRLDRARELYAQLLETIAQPGHVGLDESAYEFTRLLLASALAMMEVGLGLPAGIERVADIEANPLFQVTAMQLRMQHYAWQGESDVAAQCRKQLEVLRLQSSARQTFENTYLVWQLMAQVACDDVARVKQSLAEIAPLAERFAGWRPVLAFGRAEYLRLRGDHAAAQAELAGELARLKAGDHQLWAQLAAAEIRAFDAAGESAEAVRRGRAHLEALERAELGDSARQSLLLPLSAAEAHAGQLDAARETGDLALAHALAAGTTGINLALAYEACAWVALARRERAQYEAMLKACEGALRGVRDSALTSKLWQLKRQAQATGLAPVVLDPQLGFLQAGESVLESRISNCASSSERAHTMLALLAQQSGCQEGFLYQVTHEGPRWVASLGEQSPSERLESIARNFVQAELSAGEMITDVGTSQWSSLELDEREQTYRPVLLSHYVEGECVITGLALLHVDSGQAFVYPGETASRISRCLHELEKGTGMAVTGLDV
jgi:serine/threonine-protein kinase